MDQKVNTLTFEEYKECLESEQLVLNGNITPAEILPRHHRIFSCIQQYNIKGPTLDAACGNAVFYPAIAKFKTEMLPYSVSDLVQHEIMFGGQKIECLAWECEKSTIPLADNSLGCVLFCDVLEHLLIDPIWAILEFNRVLRLGGHLIISTPNACHIRKVLEVYMGINPATENQIKPTSPYQRHNREWTINELNTLSSCTGFKGLGFSTNHSLLKEIDLALFELGKESKLTELEINNFGPEIFYIAEKIEHKNLSNTTDINNRWPEWLYTPYPNYRRRPGVFPINIGKDYG